MCLIGCNWNKKSYKSITTTLNWADFIVFSHQDMSGLVLQSKDNIMQLAQTKADLVELENELFIRKEHVKTDVRRAVQDLMR